MRRSASLTTIGSGWSSNTRRAGRPIWAVQPLRWRNGWKLWVSLLGFRVWWLGSHWASFFYEKLSSVRSHLDVWALDQQGYYPIINLNAILNNTYSFSHEALVPNIPHLYFEQNNNDDNCLVGYLNPNLCKLILGTSTPSSPTPTTPFCSSNGQFRPVEWNKSCNFFKYSRPFVIEPYLIFKDFAPSIDSLTF
jgi:hypothetical protein